MQDAHNGSTKTPASADSSQDTAPTQGVNPLQVDTDLAKAAMNYARLGYFVFPCQPGGKDPAVGGGFKAASNDPETVAAFWNRNPEANIGIWPAGSGHVVLDIDTKGNAGGAESFEALKLMYGDLPDGTPGVLTPSGGFHVWLSIPEGKDAPGNRPAAQGIDVRSANGYVIAPPSRTSAGEYAPREGTPDLGAPSSTPVIPDVWFGSLSRKANKAPKAADAEGGGDAVDLPDDIERAEAYAEHTAPPAIEGEGGSEQTFKVACAIRDMGLSLDENFRVMCEFYNPRCEPQWDEDQDGTGPEYLMGRVASAYKNARNTEAGTCSTRHAHKSFEQYADPDAQIPQRKTQTGTKLAVVQDGGTPANPKDNGPAGAPKNVKVVHPNPQTLPDRVTEIAPGCVLPDDLPPIPVKTDDDGKIMVRSAYTAMKFVEALGLDPAFNLRSGRAELRAGKRALKAPLASRVGGQFYADGEQTKAALSRLSEAVLGVSIAGTQVSEAAVELAALNAYDPVVEKLQSLEWDGTPRLDTMMPDLFGTEDTAYYRHVGRLMLLGAVGRAFHPGCKFDYLVVLQSSEQGYGKSTAIKILGAPWAVEGIKLRNEAVETVTQLQGSWIAELSELGGLSRTGINDVKDFLSLGEDTVRMKYAAYAEKRPRDFIMIGTTNENDFLTDPTGHRRFLPVKCGMIDTGALRVQRDQLLAEAVHTFKALQAEAIANAHDAEHRAEFESYGPPLVMPRELADEIAKMHAGFEDAPEWDEDLDQFLAEGYDAWKSGSMKPQELDPVSLPDPKTHRRVRFKQIEEFLELKGLASGRDQSRLSRTVAKVMKRKGWVQSRLRDSKGYQFRVYVAPDAE